MKILFLHPEEIMKRISFTVINDLVTDQRVHRSAQTLFENNADVLLIGRILPGSIPVNRDYRTLRLNLIFNKGSLFYIEYNIRLFFLLLFKKIDILVAIDVDTLPANYLVSLIRRKPLVFDAHELFTELPELVGRNTVKKVWEWIEKSLLPKIKYAYTVCNSIAEAYRQLYGIEMKVVRNVPLKKDIVKDCTKFPFLEGKEFVLYQGSINKGRGLELLCDAFDYINEYICVIAGQGDIIEELKQYVRSRKLEDKVYIIGRLPLEDLHALTCCASLGVSIEEHLGLNYYYALPNKLFDYIQARVPVLVSGFPEMKNIVEMYVIGELVNSRKPEELAQQIISMLQSPDREMWKHNLEKAAAELNWEKEKEILLGVFGELLKIKDKKIKDKS